MVTVDTQNSFQLFQPLFSRGLADYNEILLQCPYPVLFYEFTTPGQTGGRPMFDGLTYTASACSDVLFIRNSPGSTLEFVGAGTAVRCLKIFPGAKYFGVRFAPGMFLTYDGVSAREAVNGELFFSCKNGNIKEFFGNLKKTAGLGEKTELFHLYFGDLPKQCRVNKLTQSVMDEIYSRRGNIRISQIAEDSNYSERHISRIFQENMGLSPKAFARIIRFQYALDILLHTPAGLAGDFFYDLGYSDQAHFQREFKEYTGTTPKTLYGYFHKNRN